jgi:hypothetical protein
MLAMAAAAFISALLVLLVRLPEIGGRSNDFGFRKR